MHKMKKIRDEMTTHGKQRKFITKLIFKTKLEKHHDTEIKFFVLNNNSKFIFRMIQVVNKFHYFTITILNGRK